MIIPRRLLPALFVKNDTVSGIMGNRQGNNSEARPPAKPIKNTVSKPFDSTLSVETEEDVLHAVTGLSRLIDSMSILFETEADEAPVPVNIFKEGEDSG